MAALRVTLLIEDVADAVVPKDVERIEVGLISGDYDAEAKRLIGLMVEHVAHRLQHAGEEDDDV